MNGNEEATQPTDGIGTIGQRQKCITTTSSTPPPTDDSTQVGYVGIKEMQGNGRDLNVRCMYYLRWGATRRGRSTTCQQAILFTVFFCLSLLGAWLAEWRGSRGFCTYWNKSDLTLLSIYVLVLRHVYSLPEVGQIMKGAPHYLWLWSIRHAGQECWKIAFKRYIYKRN